MLAKTEKNNVQAKASNDMLDKLKDKTRGNLTKNEEKVMLTTLSNLYLNYSDEVSKEPSAEPKEQEKKEENK